MTAQRDSTSRRTATRAGWIALLAVGLAPACASDMVRYDQAGRTSLWNKQRGYSVELPQLDAAEGWREFRLDDADLAFRNRDGSTLSLQSSCRDRKAAPALLARHLAIGVPAAGRQGAPVELRGDPGWRQSFEASEQGVTVRVHTLSLVGGGCVFDWILVTRDAAALEKLEPVFDAWWQSFRRGVTVDPRRSPATANLEASR